MNRFRARSLGLATCAALLMTLPEVGRALARPIVRVSALCPSGPDAVGSLGVGYPVSDIEANLGNARVYGESQPDYSGVSARWTATPGDIGAWRGVVAVAFTGDLDRHAQDLAGVVAKPEVLVVCRGGASQVDSDRIRNEISALMTSRSDRAFLSVSKNDDGVNVQLAGARRDLADQLLRQYPRGLSVILGRFAYPDASKTRNVETCPLLRDLPKSALVTWQRPKPVRVKVGGLALVPLTLRAIGRNGVRFTTPGPAVVVWPGTRVVVASAAGIASALPEDPGQPTINGRATITVGVSSFDTCDPALGWTLPKGRYELRSELRIGDQDTLTPAVPLIIE